MSSMVHGHWFSQGADIAPLLAIRLAVFARGRDALDDLAQQVAVYDGDTIVGTARLWWQDGAFRVGDLCVTEEMRGRGFGDLLIRLALFKALTHGAQRIDLTAPKNVQPFFAKYGFALTDDQSGEMSIRADAVHLSHCGGHCESCDHASEQCLPKALR